MNLSKSPFSNLLGIITLILFQACSLKPTAWQPPKKPALTGAYALNEKLGKTTWIDLKGWYGPEDIAVDQEGNLYCGVHVTQEDFTDGRILKIDTAGNITTFANTGSWVAGLHFDQTGNLIGCDQKRGLISVDPNGKITTLVNKDAEGTPLKFLNDVDIASDGMIYFSNTSSTLTFSRLHARKIIMEVKPDKGLYSFNPKTKEIKTLIDTTFFANGVAVSQNDDFVLMVDLTKYRVMRHWLKGDQKGQTEIFLDNLPGLPNGVSRRADGSFWLGFTTRRDDLLDKIQPQPFVKKMIYAIPLSLQPKQESFGMIMHISEAGEVLETFYDTTGKLVSEASSIEEHNGYLYLGGDLTDHIGRYKLPVENLSLGH